jgi:hypothetical protein
MAEGDTIQFDLVKLPEGGRILRLTDAQSGCLWKKNSSQPPRLSAKKTAFFKCFWPRWRKPS